MADPVVLWIWRVCMALGVVALVLCVVLTVQVWHLLRRK